MSFLQALRLLLPRGAGQSGARLEGEPARRPDHRGQPASSAAPSCSRAATSPALGRALARARRGSSSTSSPGDAGGGGRALRGRGGARPAWVAAASRRSPAAGARQRFRELPEPLRPGRGLGGGAAAGLARDRACARPAARRRRLRGLARRLAARGPRSRWWTTTASGWRSSRRWSRCCAAVGLALGGVLLAAAIFTIGSVIRLTAYLHQRGDLDPAPGGRHRVLHPRPVLRRGAAAGAARRRCSPRRPLRRLAGCAQVAAAESLLATAPRRATSSPRARRLRWSLLGGAAGLLGAIASLRRETLRGEALERLQRKRPRRSGAFRNRSRYGASRLRDGEDRPRPAVARSR